MHVARETVRHALQAWWYFVSIIFISAATLYLPHNSLLGNGAGALLVIVGLLIKFLLNFSFVPMIAEGITNIRVLFAKAWLYLKKHWFALVKLVIILIIPAMLIN